ncbi:Uncharacterised protein [Chlamydia abortus]|nr:Uncharacterised protein [Chlamydia abortus]
MYAAQDNPSSLSVAQGSQEVSERKLAHRELQDCYAPVQTMAAWVEWETDALLLFLET